MSGERLDAHRVGPEVTELVRAFSVARTMEAAKEEPMSTVCPHSTLSERRHEPVPAAFDRALHA